MRSVAYVLSSALLGASSPAVAAERASTNYPNKPIRILVGQAPGGAVDIISRGLAQKLTDAFGHPVVIDNRSGAAGSIAAALVANAAPDGYTVLFVSSSYSINPSLYKKLPYDPNRDLQPVTLIASSPFVVLAHPSVGVKGIKDLIALAKSKPKHLNYGSGGTGSSGHLAGVLFGNLAQVELTHVPYKGAGPALSDVIGGQLHLVFSSIVSGLPHATSGKLTALAVTSGKRSSAAPNLPTVAESGVPRYEFSSWYGLLVPRLTPKAIVGRLNSAVVGALNQPDFKERLSKEGTEAVGSSPEQFAVFLREEIAKWGSLVKASGIQAE